MLRPLLAAALAICFAIAHPIGPALAGGVFGDLVENLCGNCGAGRALDQAHDDLGRPLDIPGRIAQEATVETLGPLLAEAIRHSRNEARRAGTTPMTREMKFHMSPYFDEDILSRVQFRIGQGGELSVEMNSFRFGDAVAVALIDTVVFSSHNNSTSTSLWAHELFHIFQYREWGLTDFGKRYVRSYRSVEADAERKEARFSAEHPYVLGNVSSHPDGPRNEPWVYLGIYHNGWVERNFDWDQNREYLPMLGSEITANRGVNVRQDHIKYDAVTDDWRNAPSIYAATRGTRFKVLRLRDVTGGQGYYWAMIQEL